MGDACSSFCPQDDDIKTMADSAGQGDGLGDTLLQDDPGLRGSVDDVPRRTSLVAGGSAEDGEEEEEEEAMRRFQVKLGGDWKDMSMDELKQIHASLNAVDSTPDAAIEVTARGQTCTVDLRRMKQTNVASSKSRDIREVDESGVEMKTSDHLLYIRPRDLGEPWDPMSPSQPDWKFEIEKGKWKSYTLEESVLLDQYHDAYIRVKNRGEAAFLAKVRLMKKNATVDLAEMTCTIGSGYPRKLQKDSKQTDWLSNTYFFEAFTAALKKSGVDVESSAEEMFDFRFNQDFRDAEDDGRKLFRGGKEYELPFGWKRFSVKVKGEPGDNSWLRDDDSGWAVAYHGTGESSLAPILATGFRVGPRQKFEAECGSGIYCTPFIDVGAHYAPKQDVKGHKVQIVLQLRVNPKSIRPVTSGSDFEKKYWVINNPAEDMRAYGVLIKES